jgi:hypothetical protein
MWWNRRWDALIKHGVFDCLNTSMLAFYHSALQIGGVPSALPRPGERCRYSSIEEMGSSRELTRIYEEVPVPPGFATR